MKFRSSRIFWTSRAKQEPAREICLDVVDLSQVGILNCLVSNLNSNIKLWLFGCSNWNPFVFSTGVSDRALLTLEPSIGIGPLFLNAVRFS